MNHPFRHVDGLERASPAALGLSANGIDHLLQQLAEAGIEMHSFMLARHGTVVAEGWWSPYERDRVQMLHSVTKAFTATAVGFAVAERLLRLDDKVVDFFPERISAAHSGNFLKMTVRHLITQTSGHDKGVSGAIWRQISTSWIDEFLKIPIPHEPGTHFQYSSATSFMLSAIITGVSGLSLNDFLKVRLFDRLKMSSIRWDIGPEGINPGGNGVSATTSDLLKLAILHSARGVFNGQTILPEEWVRQASQPYNGNPYGYHWWVMPGTPGFFAFGAFGQYAFVLPEWDVALVTTAAVPGSISVPTVGIPPVVWRCLSGIVSGPDRDSEGERRLEERLTSLRLAPISSPSGLAASIDKLDRHFVADQNADQIEKISIELNETVDLKIQASGTVHAIRAGLHGATIEGVTTLPGAGLHHGYEPSTLVYSASAAWTRENELQILCRYPETAFADTFTLIFEEIGMSFGRSVNVNGNAIARPNIYAKRSQ